jgi:hypothetical protein
MGFVCPVLRIPNRLPPRLWKWIAKAGKRKKKKRKFEKKKNLFGR